MSPTGYYYLIIIFIGSMVLISMRLKKVEESPATCGGGKQYAGVLEY